MQRNTKFLRTSYFTDIFEIWPLFCNRKSKIAVYESENEYNKAKLEANWKRAKIIACNEEGEFYAQNLADRMDEALQTIFDGDEYVALYFIPSESYPMENSYKEFSQINDYNDSYQVTILTTKEVNERLADKVNAAAVSHGLGGSYKIFNMDQDTVDDLKAYGLISYYSDSAEEVKDYLRENFDYQSGYRWSETDFGTDFISTYVNE